MKNIKRILKFGFYIWAIPFFVSCIMFPVHDTQRQLFETIVSIALACTTVYFTVKIMIDIQPPYFNNGLKIGLIWFAMNLVIDLFVFTTAFKMDLGNYITDIGLNYLEIPFISVSIAYLVQNIKQQK